LTLSSMLGMACSVVLGWRAADSLPRLVANKNPSYRKAGNGEIQPRRNRDAFSRDE